MAETGKLTIEQLQESNPELVEQIATAVREQVLAESAATIDQLAEGFKGIVNEFIDQVIGETAEIGNNVTLYHGVTLGGVSWEKVKRHPTVEDNVVIGSGAKVLGPFTVGSGSRIGSNSVVVKEVPPNSTVVGVPGRVVMAAEKRAEKTELDHGKLPDPEAKAIACLFDQIRELERKFSEMEKEYVILKNRLG